MMGRAFFGPDLVVLLKKVVMVFGRASWWLHKMERGKDGKMERVKMVASPWETTYYWCPRPKLVPSNNEKEGQKPSNYLPQYT
jgi:hypothetical protein